jgi:probable phosphoglycerate mutase
MLLILARHGNTFGPDDTPVWVGANEDFDLVETGLEQSREIGRALRAAGQCPDRIIAGPLKRTRIGAQLAAEHCGFIGDIEIDDRLREIDYGVWGGRSDAEVAEKWGMQAIEDWRERTVVPNGAGWTPQPKQIDTNVREIFQTVTQNGHGDDCVLVVTSNGILRYFHPILAGKSALPEESKVKTGRICAARIEQGHIQLLGWNQKPEECVERLT